MGSIIGKAAFAKAAAGIGTALDGIDVRSADGVFASVDLAVKTGTFYGGRVRGTIDMALRDLGGVYSRPSTVLHMGTDRTLVSYGLDAPALSYALTPAITVRGFALERTSANRVTTSTGTFSTGGSNATQAVSPVLGPDGTASLARITSSASDGYIQSPNYSLPADNSVWTWSVLVPKGTASQIVKFSNVMVGYGTFNMTLDVLTGATVNINGGTVDVDHGAIDQGNFWLLWQKAAISGGYIAQFQFRPVSGGIGAWDWGWLQLEPGYGPTSRIRTTGTADVRREKDTLTIPVPALASAGTIEVTASPPGGATTRVLAQVDDGTQSNRVTVQRVASGNIQAVFVSAGTVIATLDLGAHTPRSETRVAVGWGGGTVRAIRDGANLGQASIATPAGLKTLRLGGDTLTTSLDGPLARVATWPGLRTDLFYETPTGGLYINGDSMAAGNGTASPPNDTWWANLNNNLKRTAANVAVGGTTSSQALAVEVADTTHRNWVHLIYTGHNSPNATQTVADITAMIAHLSPDPLKRRYLIGLPTLSTAAGAGAQAILDTRAAIIANWPDNYVDVPAALYAAAVALGDTTTSDTNLANGYSPARYLGDAIHLNAAGQVVEEAAWRAKMLAKGW